MFHADPSKENDSRSESMDDSEKDCGCINQIMPCPLIRHPHQISLCPSERGMQANTKEAFSQNSL